jgi:hypothetical protein
MGAGLLPEVDLLVDGFFGALCVSLLAGACAGFAGDVVCGSCEELNPRSDGAFADASRELEKLQRSAAASTHQTLETDRTTFYFSRRYDRLETEVNLSAENSSP